MDKITNETFVNLIPKRYIVSLKAEPDYALEMSYPSLSIAIENASYLIRSFRYSDITNATIEIGCKERYYKAIYRFKLLNTRNEWLIYDLDK